MDRDAITAGHLSVRPERKTFFWSEIASRCKHFFRRNERIVFMPESSDPVTGLINRVTLFQFFKESINPGAVIVIDLDSFKHVNETHGYDVGDEVLSQIGSELQDICLRSNRFDGLSLLPAKSSGEKFVLFSSRIVSEDACWQLGSQLSKVFDKPFNTKSGPVNLHAFIGISNGSGSVNASETYLHATLAMHESRRQRNRVTFFKAELYQKQIRKQCLIKELQENDVSENFKLVFQPKINPIEPNITPKHFEALIRWTSPKSGVVSPSEFIPLAEDSRLITQIDKWVIEETIRTLSTLQLMGHSDIQISCNVSPETLVCPFMPGFINDLLLKHGVLNKSLQIEVTEHSLIKDIVQAVINLNALKERGISVALDDFGTGHSSLGSLRDLPIDTLKIDRSFLVSIHLDQKRKTLLNQVIFLGKSLDLSVVIEGVESALDIELVKHCGADLAQGFGYSIPRPMSDFFDDFKMPK